MVDVLTELNAALAGRTGDWSAADRAAIQDIAFQIGFMQGAELVGETVLPGDLTRLRNAARGITGGTLTGAQAVGAYLDRISTTIRTKIDP